MLAFTVPSPEMDRPGFPLEIEDVVCPLMQEEQQA
jgi:hypothetical protein